VLTCPDGGVELAHNVDLGHDVCGGGVPVLVRYIRSVVRVSKER
jgi:hypothetical protein